MGETDNTRSNSVPNGLSENYELRVRGAKASRNRSLMAVLSGGISCIPLIFTRDNPATVRTVCRGTSYPEAEVSEDNQLMLALLVPNEDDGTSKRDTHESSGASACRIGVEQADMNCKSMTKREMRKSRWDMSALIQKSKSWVTSEVHDASLQLRRCKNVLRGIPDPNATAFFTLLKRALANSSWKIKNILLNALTKMKSQVNGLSLRGKATVLSSVIGALSLLCSRGVNVQVHCVPTPLNRLFVTNSQALLHTFRTPILCLVSHISSTIGYLKQSPALLKTRQVIKTFDGTLLVLDWYFGKMSKESMLWDQDVLNMGYLLDKFVELLKTVPRMMLSDAEARFVREWKQDAFVKNRILNQELLTPKNGVEPATEATVNAANLPMLMSALLQNNSNFESVARSNPYLEEAESQKNIASDITRPGKGGLEQNGTFVINKIEEELHRFGKASPNVLAPYIKGGPTITNKIAALMDEQVPLALAFSSRPILLAIHGVNGNSEDHYIVSTMKLATEMGWHAVAMNLRGCGASKLANMFGYSAGGTQDIDRIVSEIRSQFPYSPFFAVGFSLGANLLAKYLGEVGEESLIDAAACCSNPWNLVECGDKGSYVRNFYQRVIVLLLKSYIKKNLTQADFVEEIKKSDETASRFISDVFDFSKTWYKLDTMQEFDTKVSSRLLDYENVIDYWSDHSSSNYVSQISVPCLCINALDDPLIPEKAIPMQSLQMNPNMILVTSDYGGHLGWPLPLPGTFSAASWGEMVVTRFFSEVVPHIRRKKFRELLRLRSDLVAQLMSLHADEAKRHLQNSKLKAGSSDRAVPNVRQSGGYDSHPDKPWKIGSSSSVNDENAKANINDVYNDKGFKPDSKKPNGPEQICRNAKRTFDRGEMSEEPWTQHSILYSKM